MAKCEEALPIILANEGGFVSNPNDPGGATKYGISLRFLRELGHAVGDVDGDGDVDADDIRKLSPKKAAELYRREFWDALGLGHLNHQGVATKIFDLAVNMGKVPAVRILQRALIKMGNPLVTDGVMGPATLAAANLSLPGILLEQIRATAKARYAELIENNPKLAAFRRGWYNRAEQ